MHLPNFSDLLTGARTVFAVVSMAIGRLWGPGQKPSAAATHPPTLPDRAFGMCRPMPIQPRPKRLEAVTVYSYTKRTETSVPIVRFFLDERGEIQSIGYVRDVREIVADVSDRCTLRPEDGERFLHGVLDAYECRVGSIHGGWYAAPDFAPLPPGPDLVH